MLFYFTSSYKIKRYNSTKIIYQKVYCQILVKFMNGLLVIKFTLILIFYGVINNVDRSFQTIRLYRPLPTNNQVRHICLNKSKSYSYLKARKQRTEADSSYSSWEAILSSIPQTSILFEVFRKRKQITHIINDFITCQFFTPLSYRCVMAGL